MKSKLSILLFFLTSNAFAQINGEWYGSVTRNNGSVSQIKIQVSKTYAAAIDFINENKPGIKPDRSQIDSVSLFIILSDRKIAIDTRYNKTADELKGEIVYGGKPASIVFTRKKPAPITVEPVKSTSSGEAVDASLSPDIDS